MNCPHCGAPLPDNARFCYSCGQPVGGPAAPAAAPAAPAVNAPAAPPAAASPTLAPAGVQALKCPSCGAPIQPVFG